SSGCCCAKAEAYCRKNVKLRLSSQSPAVSCPATTGAPASSWEPDEDAGPAESVGPRPGAGAPGLAWSPPPPLAPVPGPGLEARGAPRLSADCPAEEEQPPRERMTE